MNIRSAAVKCTLLPELISGIAPFSLLPQCPQYCELSPYGLVDRLVPDIMAEHHEDILHTFHLGKSFDSRGNLGLLWNQKIDDQPCVAYMRHASITYFAQR